MMRNMKKAVSVFLLFVLIAAGTVSLTGCHGSKGLKAFEIPEQLDTSRPYEITFWAKNDTKNPQTAIYEQAIRDL